MAQSQEGSKQIIQKEGTVEEVLPNATFKVVFQEEEKQFTALAHLSGNMRRHYIKVLPGDQVIVEFSLYNLTKGRITRRITSRN